MLPIISVESTQLEAFVFGNSLSFLVLLWRDWSLNSIRRPYMHFIPLFGQIEFIIHKKWWKVSINTKEKLVGKVWMPVRIPNVNVQDEEKMQ